MVAALHQAGVRVSVLNPARVRYFARARGQQAKTDRLDAAVLTGCGQALQPQPTPPRSAFQEQLTELVRRRVQLLELLVAQRQRAQKLSLPMLRCQAQSLIRRLERDLEQIEQQLQQLRQQEDSLDRRARALETPPGVGATNALAVLAEVPKLGTLNRRQAAVAGSAPHPRHSGQWEGRRRIGGGRVPARRALSMAALVGARVHGPMRTFYERLRPAGKPAKVTLTAVMRKLLLMNHGLKDPTLAPAQ